MATTEIKVLTKAGLVVYDEKIKEKIAADDAATLASAKSYADGLADNYDAAGTAQTKVNELANGQVKTNKEAIEVLNGADTVEGSVAKQIKDAKTALEQQITDSMYDDTALAGRVTTVEGAITTLNGEGVGSVKKQIDDAFNDFATKVSDDNVVNTFKELVDYCATHSSEAAEMAGDIQANATAISELKTFLGELPEGTSAATVIAYINEKVAAVDFSGAIETAKNEAISTAAGDATSKANKALEDAKDYADGLAVNYATAAQGTKADTALQKADIVSGSANGTISVKGEDVSVKGLGSAAYTSSASYATAEQGAKADSAVQAIVSGTDNGTISVDGVDVAVKGLGSAAYTASTAYDAAGTAETKVNALAEGAVATNTSDISTLKTKVATLESTTYVEITTAEIEEMFA